ncbi:MAG: YibE/F family protein [Aeromicrobium sp.]
MTHTHSGASVPVGRSGAPMITALVLVVLAISAGALTAMVLTWPSASDVPKGLDPYGGEGVSRVGAVVKSVDALDCNGTGAGPDNTPGVAGACGEVTAATDDGEAAKVTLDPTRFQSGISVGDQVTLLRVQPAGQTPSFEFVDFQRGVPLAALAAVFAVVVIAIARWRGLFALIGIGVTLMALTQYVLPSILAGRSPVLTAIIGSTVIMIVVLYLAHGISVRTTSALFGTLFGIAMTAGLGVLSTDLSSITGLGSEDDRLLLATVSTLNLSQVAAATMVIAGLGVLNDVTVTQASAVWEMRAFQPTASRASVFASAMRIGRDHIASSVYTLVFAYAGSAMTILLLVSAYQQDLVTVVTTEQIGQEVVRTLVGAIGLVLAVPVTTAIAVWMVPRGEKSYVGRRSAPIQP